MEYPGDFETPVFPAGKRIAVSRLMAILTLAAFLIIIFLCVILFWSGRSDSVSPFIIYTNDNTGAWEIVGKNNKTDNLSREQIIAESVAINFTRDWFKISGTPVANELAWGECDRDTCISGDGLMFGTRKCAIYCGAGDDVYSRFLYDIVPGYKNHGDKNNAQHINENNISATPVQDISENSGIWRINAIVSLDAGGEFEIIAFVKIGRNDTLYPKTMGFYITEFNSYRVH